MQIYFAIKNKISEQDFERIVREWLSEGDYTPDDIIQNIIVLEKKPKLFPLYFYQHTYAGECRVDFDYKDISVRGSVTTTVYAGSRNIADIPSPAIPFIERMIWCEEELHVLDKNDPRLSKVTSMFSMSKGEAWDNWGHDKAHARATQKTAKGLLAFQSSELSLNIDFFPTNSFSFIAPYWAFIYEYQGKPYYVIADGNDPERIEGIKPEDQKRKNNIVRLQWFGWLTGLLTIALAIFIASGESFHHIDRYWWNLAIAVAGILLTDQLVEFEVRKIKSRSRKIRQQLLNADFRNSLDILKN